MFDKVENGIIFTKLISKKGHVKRHDLFVIFNKEKRNSFYKRKKLH